MPNRKSANVTSLFPTDNPDNVGRTPYTDLHDGGDGGGDGMLQRVKELEKDVQQMKTDIAVIRSNYATKSDVSDAKTSIILWVVGAVVLSQVIPTIPLIIKMFVSP